MKAKQKKAVFILQITDNSLRLLRCNIDAKGKREFTGLINEDTGQNTDDKDLAVVVSRALGKLEYAGQPLIVALPHSKATCRHIKVPTQATQEIEKIVALQASRYLPYPAEELITGFEVISKDKAGYAELNLVIVHRDVIRRYLAIFQESKVHNFRIILSSYGLCNLYNYLKPQGAGNVILTDVDLSCMELAICPDKKIAFSRYAKLEAGSPGRQNLFIEEIKKTTDAYAKETGKGAPDKIILFEPGCGTTELSQILKTKTGLTVEILSFAKGINFSQGVLNALSVTNSSFLALIGLGLKDLPEALSLLPQEIKNTLKQAQLRKAYLQFIFITLSIVLVWAFSMAKNIDNKAGYLERLKQELSKVEKEVRPLEKIENRMKLMQRGLIERPSSLEALYEVQQVLPGNVSLASFNYENKEIILRGQAQELNSVFSLTGLLEKSEVFRDFNVKVRYATKRKTENGEVVDFEIICLRHK